MLRTTSRRTAAALVAVLAAVGGAGLTACEPAKPPTAYIAVGDSYTAGPLIPDQSTDPLGCLRSTKDYPQLVKSKIKVTKFKDVSCSGATTNDIFHAQDVTPGPANPPQLDAVTDDAKVVTLGMGGNDIGFSSIVKNCATENPFGSGCKPEYVHDGRDELLERIAATAPKIDFSIAAIKNKAPRAQIFVIGYPTILPETGSGCYPKVPILGKDVPYLRDVEHALNAMLAARAAKAGVHYIDIATPSIGHDACAGDNWVEGIIPTHVAAPVHPNATGMAKSAAVIAAAINKVVTA